MDRIVDIASDGQHLAAFRGFMTVSRDGAEIGRVPLDDIAAVIVHAHGITYSNNLLVALARQGAPVVVCASNHAPIGWFAPLEGHFAQGARMRAQWEATKPLSKQLWKQIVVAKLRMQAAVLAANGHPYGALVAMARRVRSGDPDNLEAQAARRYWPLLFGDEFRRDRNADGTNALLNYGYTVMRALLARSVVAAGLHPTIGIHHRNRVNAFALADDLIEPYRPLVDQTVRILVADGVDEVAPSAKQALTAVVRFDLHSEAMTSPVSVVAQRTAQSLAQSFETGKALLTLPEPPSADELMALGRP